MTKKQKVWLGIFLAMFIVPEIIWGTLVNALTSILHIDIHSVVLDALFFSHHPGYAYLIILMEIIGLSGLLVLNMRGAYNKIVRNFINIIMVILLLSLILLLFLNFSISNMSFG